MALATADSDPFFYVLQDALRILYVDDDPILREFAQVHLTTDSATISTAEDGVAALESMEAQVPDLVLLDLEMPRMDGFEVLARMRAEGPLQRTPVIVVTGREDVAAIDRAFQAGATSFVVKPINWRLLSHQIRYIHRMHGAEVEVMAAQSKAVDLLAEITRAGSKFLAEALKINPALAPVAGDYLGALEAAHAAGLKRTAS